ncbi:Cupin_1 domain-containing protein [Cephalotus follicularis]|uniref:Cupin_1 domain-containing protein n=1 Tax=Cephalotus follicularis TaxID=3775 RepID=A0A1Q3BNT0_CEPFO|nr:Cupin_1 domain-containing protein [Cephalotus follicularis]
MNKSLVLPFSVFALVLIHVLSLSLNTEAVREDIDNLGQVVKRKHRRSLVVTEYGEISAVKISDGTRGPSHLQFITLEPNSLFLPVLLHTNMVFYVHTGSGILSWGNEDDIKRVNLRRGDIYRLQAGSVFFVEGNLEPEREKLRLHAIFSNTDKDLYEPDIGAYSSISDLVLGFDRKVLRSAFKVPEDVIEEIVNATKPPAIVHAMPKTKTTFWEMETRFLKAFLGSGGGSLHSMNNKKKTRAYNILNADPDFKNPNGWSVTVTKKDFHLLKGSDIGVFMVNLTKGSMMGPHWNPEGTEISIVLHGEGMVRVVCSSIANKSECKNMSFRVNEGDVFAVPRFHPMAQMSFNNDSFVFMGFSTTTKKNYPQFLTGKRSVLQVIDKEILAVSFNVTNSTIDQLLAKQTESIILECTTCAEEEERIIKEEIEKEREEEEARKREEEEEERRREEEEERKREEEESRKREEEEERWREEEEERRREEEEARKEEEEEEREEREQEEEKEKEQEESRRREEEKEERKKQKEERKRREEAAKREQEEARRQEEERERRAKEEEEEREEEDSRREEEERKKREQKEEKEIEQEEDRRREEEKEGRKKQKDEERKRREEAVEREQEEARKQEEKRERREREKEEEEEESKDEPEEEEHEGGGYNSDKEGRRVLKVEAQV